MCLLYVSYHVPFCLCCNIFATTNHHHLVQIARLQLQYLPVAEAKTPDPPAKGEKVRSSSMQVEVGHSNNM